MLFACIGVMMMLKQCDDSCEKTIYQPVSWWDLLNFLGICCCYADDKWKGYPMHRRMKVGKDSSEWMPAAQAKKESLHFPSSHKNSSATKNSSTLRTYYTTGTTKTWTWVLEISLLGKCTNSSSLLWVSFCQKIYIYVYIIFNNVENFFPIFIFLSRNTKFVHKSREYFRIS